MFLHSLSFSIDYNGKAEIFSAFPVSVHKQLNKPESSFRGRKLIGHSQEIPELLESK